MVLGYYLTSTRENLSRQRKCFCQKYNMNPIFRGVANCYHDKINITNVVFVLNRESLKYLSYTYMVSLCQTHSYLARYIIITLLWFNYMLTIIKIVFLVISFCFYHLQRLMHQGPIMILILFHCSCACGCIWLNHHWVQLSFVNKESEAGLEISFVISELWMGQ